MEHKVAVLRSPGQLNSLAFENRTPGEVSPLCIEIEVEAAALNFKDVLVALELIPWLGEGVPSLGYECAGTVSRVGAGVTNFAPGDEVVAIGTGCLATSVCVDSSLVCRRPRSISALGAVTIPIAFVTAGYALEDLARLKPGDRVLIHAATGGVGMAAVQIARRIGARIFATAGNEEKRNYLRSLGIAHVMNSRSSAFEAEVLATTDGAGVDVVLNSLSGELVQSSLRVLAPHGRFIELGARDAIAGNSLALSAFRRGGSYCAIGYEAPLPRLGERLAAVLQRASSGELRPLPMRVFSAAEAGEALGFLASAQHIGKVVVTVSGRSTACQLASVAKGDDESQDLLSAEEGAQIFEMCLAGRRANYAVSKTHLYQRTAVQARVPSAPQTAAPRAHPRPPLNTPFVAPQTLMQSTIAEIWAQTLSLEKVGVQDNFFDLGGDSLLAVQLAHALRSPLGADVATHLIIENPTVEDLAGRLGTGPTSKPRSKHLVRLAEGPTSVAPIFLIHPIGGHVYFYRPLAEQLARAAPVWGLQAQGSDGEALPLETIEEMALAYNAAIREVQPAGPYRLAGASFGGMVCYEMALQLARAGETVELLALVDSPAPGPQIFPFQSDAELLAYVLGKGEDAAIERHLRELSGKSDHAMWIYFLREGGERQLPHSATAESVRHFLRLFRANFEAMNRYRPGRYESGGLYLCASSHDVYNTRHFPEIWASYFKRLEIAIVPGNHTTMNLPPNCEHIANRICAAIQRPPLTIGTPRGSGCEAVS